MINFSENDDNLFEMANKSKSKTGLPYNIYLSIKPQNKKDNTFRVKIQNDYADKFNINNLISVVIDIHTFNYKVISSSKVKLSDKEIKMSVDYVKQNAKPIFDYWNGLIDSDDLSVLCKKLS
jgi:hypothetical protein